MASDPNEISQGDILQHAEWVRRLALALVRNSDEADELSQETWTAALARPPREAGPLRPWLGGVARNLARMRARTSGRRARREEASERPEVSPSPEELVARAEMQQQVARRVLDLDEPFRSTLLLRYYEGCSAAEIARRQDVPAGTVRWRLKRGLDDLRKQLDDAHQGDRKRWVLALAPLPGAAIQPASGPTLLGVIAMKTTYKIGLVILIALLAVVGYRYVRTDKKSPSTAPTASATPNKSNAAPTAHFATAPVTREDDPTGTMRLEGQVIDANEKPVAGATVAIDTNPSRMVTTEPDGSFAFDRLIGRDYKLEARAGDGYAGPTFLRLAKETEPVILRIGPGASITIEVRDAESGSPIAGAAVELRSTLSWTAITGSDGIARLSGVGGTGFDMSLKVAAPGYAPELRRAPSSGDDRRVLMTLHRGAGVSGIAVTTDGRSIASACVLAVPTSEPFPLVEAPRDCVTTDAHGAWSVASLASGTYRFVLSHPDYEPATTAPVVVDGVTPRTGIEIRAAAGGELRGKVTSANGVVVAADVRVVASGSVEWRTAHHAFTDARGEYVFHGLPRRHVQVVASHASGSSSLIDVDLTTTAKATADLDLSIDGAIDGTVVTDTGEAVPEAQIVAEPDGGDRESWAVRGDQYGIADSAGKFRIGGLPPGNYRVRAARPGTSEAMLWTQVGLVVPANTTGLKLTVGSPGKVKGRVLYDDGTAPAAFTLAVGYGTPVPFATLDGRFSIDVPGGALNLIVSGSTFIRKVVTLDGNATELGTITVTRGRSISGRVFDASGAPVAAATVAAGSLLTGDGQKLYIDSESVGARQTETDDQGRYMLSGFSSAAITLTAGKDAVGRSQSVSIPSGPSSAEVDLVLAPTGAVSGIARLDGAPLADTTIIASPTNGSSSNFFVTTGPDGSFAFDALSPGRYALTPVLAGGAKYFVRADLAAGQRAKVDIDVTTGSGTVAVTVQTAAGKPVAVAKVAVVGLVVDAPNMAALRYQALLPSLPADGPPIPFITRNTVDGAVRVDHLKPGPYTVCATPLPGDPSNPAVAQQLQDQQNHLPMKCMPVTIDTGEKKVTVTAP
ncbi:MAG: sigma-70 family RNA polymerase sigma factor [Kofleriaceae bacterium]